MREHPLGTINHRCRRVAAVSAIGALAILSVLSRPAVAAPDSIRVQLLPIMVKVTPTKASPKSKGPRLTAVGFITIIGHVVNEDRIERFCAFAPSIRDAYNQYFMSAGVPIKPDGHLVLDGMKDDLIRVTTKVIGNRTINDLEVIEGVHQEAGSLSGRFSHLQGCRVID